jgi:hypothetical protein
LSIIYWNFVYYIYHTNAVNYLKYFTVSHRIKPYSTSERNVKSFLIHFPLSLAEIKNKEFSQLWNRSQHYRQEWRCVLPTNVSYVTSHKNVIKCLSPKNVPDFLKTNMSVGFSSLLPTAPVHKLLDKREWTLNDTQDNSLHIVLFWLITQQFIFRKILFISMYACIT